MKNNKSKKELDFESAFDELQNIQNKIDSGDLSLDDSVELYKRGSYLIKFCEEKLKSVEQEIKILQKNTLKDFKQ